MLWKGWLLFNCHHLNEAASQPQQVLSFPHLSFFPWHPSPDICLVVQGLRGQWPHLSDLLPNTWSYTPVWHAKGETHSEGRSLNMSPPLRVSPGHQHRGSDCFLLSHLFPFHMRQFPLETFPQYSEACKQNRASESTGEQEAGRFPGHTGPSYAGVLPPGSVLGQGRLAVRDQP